MSIYDLRVHNEIYCIIIQIILMLDKKTIPS